MMAESEQERKTARKTRPPRKFNGRRQPILPTAIYNRPAAALVADCSIITLIRAYSAGHLFGYRQGRYVKHSGQHLLDWLESGGLTGWKKGGAADD
jgi:hypothetical protein